MSNFGVEKGIIIRQPSTANLMIDTNDRDDTIYNSPWQFQINKSQSIMNGQFTRIATTEVVLEWFESNVQGATGLKNNYIIFDLSGIAPNTHASTQQITLFEDNYTVAAVLDALAKELNDLSGTTGMTWSIQTSPNVGLKATGGWFTINESTLANQLDFLSIGGQDIIAHLGEPDLRPYRYLDFVSPQVTLNQYLKDNSTATNPKDVLCRWYFAYDEQNLIDKYGYPILMGYTQFVSRRIFNPPKQIHWSNQQPLGNLAFEVYGDNGEIVPDNFTTSQWLMTLQFSEN